MGTTSPVLSTSATVTASVTPSISPKGFTYFLITVATIFIGTLLKRIFCCVIPVLIDSFPLKIFAIATSGRCRI